MLKRVSALTMALALGVVMAGCQPAEEGGGGGMEQREPGETMTSPAPGNGVTEPAPGTEGGGGGTMNKDKDDHAAPGNNP